MAQYIDKSALVAEIEKRIKEINEIGTYLSPKGVLTNLLCYLNTHQNHQDVISPNGCIVLEDFNGGEGFYKLNLDYLNKMQVEEVEEMVRTWNKESKTSNENIKNCIGMCLTDVDEQRFKDYNTNLKDCLAWLENPQKNGLEKQGLQILANSAKTCKDEQKPAGVKPKFKVGDWVVYDGWVCQIIDVTEDGYCNSEHGFIPKDRKDSMRLWTIQDAKDGDVLVHNGCTFIFMGIKNGIVMGFEENIMDGKNPVCFGEPDKDNDYYPATKEQRDTLMKAMADAGYAFDFVKKELKKIVTPKFKIGDKVYSLKNRFECTIESIDETTYYGDTTNFDIKDQNNWKLVEQNPAWSEEDEDYINDLIKYFSQNERLNNTKEDIVNWLESIRPKNTWKPSDKQMEVLWKYAEQNNYDGFILTSLHEDLKKLREE